MGGNCIQVAATLAGCFPNVAAATAALDAELAKHEARPTPAPKKADGWGTKGGGYHASVLAACLPRGCFQKVRSRHAIPSMCMDNTNHTHSQVPGNPAARQAEFFERIRTGQDVMLVVGMLNATTQISRVDHRKWAADGNGNPIDELHMTVAVPRGGAGNMPCSPGGLLVDADAVLSLTKDSLGGFGRRPDAIFTIIHAIYIVNHNVGPAAALPNIPSHIVATRRKGGRTEYRIAWQGWEAGPDTWEPKTNVLERLLKKKIP